MKRYESELICDFAEYYHILDYKSITPCLAATLLEGLKPESRTKMKLTNQKLTVEQILLATIADEIKLLVWMQGRKKNSKKPESLLNLLINGKNEPNKCKGFNSGADFDKYWRKITGVKHE